MMKSCSRPPCDFLQRVSTRLACSGVDSQSASGSSRTALRSLAGAPAGPSTRSASPTAAGRVAPRCWVWRRPRRGTPPSPLRAARIDRAPHPRPAAARRVPPPSAAPCPAPTPPRRRTPRPPPAASGTAVAPIRSASLASLPRVIDEPRVHLHPGHPARAHAVLPSYDTVFILPVFNPTPPATGIRTPLGAPPVDLSDIAPTFTIDFTFPTGPQPRR